ncbi:MAG: hypothetical protein EXS50_00630 [Candidatus Taylorbacteria bacterium]|nr:hypothetical protein [Candidatus Taylorbacteria bacterium]
MPNKTHWHMDASTYSLPKGASTENELTLLDRYQSYENWHHDDGRGCWHRLEIMPLLLVSRNALSMSEDYPGVIILRGHFKESDIRDIIKARLPFGVSHLKGLDNARLPFKPNFE